MGYEPVDLSTHPAFTPNILSSRGLLVVPSQGERGTSIITGVEGEMLYEHRQEGEAISASRSVFVSRSRLPPAEDRYRSKLFGRARPTWIVSRCPTGEPLDSSILNNESTVAALTATADSLPGLSLYGFNQTAEMGLLAQRLRMPYYGNPSFAKRFGGKIGLVELLKEANLPSLATFELRNPQADLTKCVESLKDLGYEKFVVKVDRSTGGMGHLVSSIGEALANRAAVERFVPREFTPAEGGIVQGWIDSTDSVSLATFVDFDGRVYLTGAQVHLLGAESIHAAIGARPIERKYIAPMLKIAEALQQAYQRHSAWGPHTMGMVFPEPTACQALGLTEGVPLCIDENSRPGASTISKAWILNVRGGRYGIGWSVSRVAVPAGTWIADVINTLDERRLLINEIGPEAHGVFVFNGSALDFGYGSAFHAIAISRADDPTESMEMMNVVRRIFSR